MKLSKRVSFWLLPLIASWIMRLLYRTNRKVFKLKAPLPEEPFIVAFWHGELLMDPFLYLHFRKKSKLKIMISEHSDGEYIARTMAHFGLEAVRGSTGRAGAVKALKGAITAMEEGWDIAISPDGPRGPRHSVADGIIALARRQNCKIVAIRFSATQYWRIPSWDQFIVPKPFGTMIFEGTEPFSVSGMDNDTARAKIAQKLRQGNN